MRKTAVYLGLVLTQVAALPQVTPSRVTVLVTSGTESETTTTARGAATTLGGVAVGTAGSGSSTYEHSEVWEVVRRFTAECPGITFVVNPSTPHSLEIHADYEKVASMVLGKVALYQLSLLNATGDPLYVSKKNYLRREIKPICRMIQRQ